MSDPEAAGETAFDRLAEHYAAAPERSVMSIVRDLGEKLGGAPWVKPVEEMPRVAAPRMPNPALWPEHVRAEMEAILRGERDGQP